MTKKRTRKRKKPKQQTLASITGVNPPRTHGFGVWGNQRVVVGVRVDEKLADQFKTVAKQVFGSVCRPVEAFMATVVSTYQTTTLDKPLGVNPSITIDIGKMVIERNVRTRRKLVVEEETEETTKLTQVKCEFGGCDKVAKFEAFMAPLRGSNEQRSKFYCDKHLKLRSKHGLGPGAIVGYKALGSVVHGH